MTFNFYHYLHLKVNANNFPQDENKRKTSNHNFSSYLFLILLIIIIVETTDLMFEWWEILYTVSLLLYKAAIPIFSYIWREISCYFKGLHELLKPYSLRIKPQQALLPSVILVNLQHRSWDIEQRALTDRIHTMECAC